MSFADLGISKSVVSALAERGFTQPFPVQEMAIRDALAGHDLLVQSPTGSGKTLAFGIPLVDRLDSDARQLSALVLAPTRELASQIVDELQSIARARHLKIAAVYGGLGFGPTVTAAKRAHIIVATPGRLEDLLARGAISLGESESSSLTRLTGRATWARSWPVSRICSAGHPEAARQALLFLRHAAGGDRRACRCSTLATRDAVTPRLPPSTATQTSSNIASSDPLPKRELDRPRWPASRRRRRANTGIRSHQWGAEPTGSSDFEIANRSTP